MSKKNRNRENNTEEVLLNQEVITENNNEEVTNTEEVITETITNEDNNENNEEVITEGEIENTEVIQTNIETTTENNNEEVTNTEEKTTESITNNKEENEEVVEEVKVTGRGRVIEIDVLNKNKGNVVKERIADITKNVVVEDKKVVIGPLKNDEMTEVVRKLLIRKGLRGRIVYR